MSQQQKQKEWEVGPTIKPLEGPHYVTVKEGGSRVCDVYGDFSNSPQAENLAAFIVQAVNAHADLLETLKWVLPYLKHSQKFYRYQHAGKEFWPNREEAEANIVKAEAAIAKAGKNGAAV